MQSQLVRLGRNAAIYGVAQVLSRFITFLLLPLYTRELTPSDYGVISILGLAALFATNVFSLGLTTSLGVSYFGGDSPTRRPASIWTAFGILCLSAVVLAVTGIVGSRAIAGLIFQSTDGYDLPFLVGLTATSAAISLLAPPFLQYLQFEERAKQLVAISLASTILSIVFSVVGVVVLHLHVLGFMAANLLGQCAALGLAVTPALRRLPVILDRGIAAELVRLGVPVVPAFAFLFVIQQANKFVLQVDDGLDSVGIYAIGFNLGNLMTLIVGGFTMAWYPFFLSFSDRTEEAKPVFARVMTYYIIGFGLIDIGFFVGARAVVSVMTAAPFHDAYLTVGASAATQYLVGIFSISLAGMYFAKQVKYISLMQGISALIAVVSALVLVPMLGILGASISLVLGYVAMVILQLAWNSWRAYLRVPYDGRRIGLFLGIHAVAVLIGLWPRSVPVAAELAIAVVTYIAAILACLLLLTAEERTAARDAIGRFRPRRAVGAA